MALARWQATIVDDEGNVLPAATVTVRLEATGNLANLKSDRAGASGIANPLTADPDGYAAFHVVGGSYKITAALGAFTREWRYVAIGTGAETDVAGGVTRVHTAAGAATVAATDECLVINKTVGEATVVNVPAALARGGVDVMIKDGRGDADTNPIMPALSGSETCDGLGLPGDSPGLEIRTPYGFLWMRPYPDGSGYFMMPSQL